MDRALIGRDASGKGWLRTIINEEQHAVDHFEDEPLASE